MKRVLFAKYYGREYSPGRMKDGKFILKSYELIDLKESFQKCVPF